MISCLTISSFYYSSLNSVITTLSSVDYTLLVSILSSFDAAVFNSSPSSSYYSKVLWPLVVSLLTFYFICAILSKTCYSISVDFYCITFSTYFLSILVFAYLISNASHVLFLITHICYSSSTTFYT